MRALIFFLAVALLTACSTTSPRETMQRSVDQATAIVERFQAIPEQSIPPSILRASRGLAIMTVTKGGFIASGRGGSGIVIARLPGGGWSGPSAIGTGGVGIGFQAGVQVTEFVIVLNTPAAVDAFSRGGNVTLGGNLSVAAGPVGRAAEGSVALGAAMFTYSRSQGLFAGVSLEGTVISTRDELNRDYYGDSAVTATQILTGRVRPPAGAQRLISLLSGY